MPRPPHLHPGDVLGERYAIEGLVRVAEGRMFYLATDAPGGSRPCGECGSTSSPGTANICHACGVPLTPRRLLVAARWGDEALDRFERFASMHVRHPGIAAPTDVVRDGGQLYSVLPYGGEGLMVDEAAPFANQRVLSIAQRMLGSIVYLARQGVAVETVRRANLLIEPSGVVRLFDFDVAGVSDEGMGDAVLDAPLRALGALLAEYCHVRSTGLASLLNAMAEGTAGPAGELGREFERRFDDLGVEVYSPRAGAMSDVGLARQLNEDHWGWLRLDDGRELYVVADGMGGHDCGEVASHVAVDTVRQIALDVGQRPEGRSLDDVLHLDAAFLRANQAVQDEARQRGSDMGTTLVGMLVDADGRAEFANVGDSRAYLVREGRLQQITVDHSLVQRLVETGRLAPEEARGHPHSNILLRTIGSDGDLEVDRFEVTLRSGDRVLLCSDGLWGEVEDDALLSIVLAHQDPRRAARELVRAAHEGGGRDNVTLLLVTMP